MKTVTVKISEDDYSDMLKHFVKGNPGTILVGVREVIAMEGEFANPDRMAREVLALREAVEREQKRASARC